MHVKLFNAVGLATGVSEVSQAVAMGSNTKAAMSLIVFNGTVDVEYQESNDLENWSIVGAATAAITGPYSAPGGQTIEMAYVRVKITESGGAASAVASAELNLSA